MFISKAHAHGLLGGEAGAHDGPLILLAIAVVVILLLVAEKKWRRRKHRLQIAADQVSEVVAESTTADETFRI
ncbi:MAG: hypothetical protein OER92_03065 [Alphaproteobacteria bacterium]|nr:hypothetical protein [Alphaproteobacteria bacterium]